VKHVCAAIFLDVKNIIVVVQTAKLWDKLFLTQAFKMTNPA